VNRFGSVLLRYLIGITFTVPVILVTLLLLWGIVSTILLLASRLTGFDSRVAPEAVSYLALTLTGATFLYRGGSLTEWVSQKTNSMARHQDFRQVLRPPLLRVVPYIGLVPLYIYANLDKLSGGLLWPLAAPFYRDAVVEAVLTLLAIDALRIAASEFREHMFV
jgi:hypothetical protein